LCSAWSSVRDTSSVLHAVEDRAVGAVAIIGRDVLEERGDHQSWASMNCPAAPP
jgi:hypothetical protein